MSSIIRSAELSSEPRILSVKKGAPVARPGASENRKPENTETRKVKADDKKALDKLAGAALPEGERFQRSEIDAIPEVLYGKEVQTQLSELKAKLIDAQEEIESLNKSINEKREQAEQEGYNAGLDRAMKEADLLIKEKTASIGKLVNSINSARTKVMEECETSLVEIAMAAIAKILGVALTTKEGIIAAVRQATRNVNNREKMLIRVSPEDYSVLKDNGFELSQTEGVSKAEFVVDEQVSLGGCIIEAEGGSLDSRLEVQLKILTNTLLKARSQRFSARQESK